MAVAVSVCLVCTCISEHNFIILVNICSQFKYAIFRLLLMVRKMLALVGRPQGVKEATRRVAIAPNLLVKEAKEGVKRLLTHPQPRTRVN